MRVLRVAGSIDLRVGGPAWSVVHSACAATRAGLDVTLMFVAVDPASTLRQSNVALLQRHGVRTRCFRPPGFVGRAGPRYAVSAALVRSLMRRWSEFDVIHCHSAWLLATVAAAVRRSSGVPLILSPHESLADYDIATSRAALTSVSKRHLRRFLLKSFDTIIYSSELERDDSDPTRLGRRSIVIPHAVYDEPRTLGWGEDLPSLGSGLRLGFIGRYDPKKNLDMLLRALAAAPPGISLDVAGGGGPLSQGHYVELARQLGVADRVRWLGFVDGQAKDEFYRDIHMLVMPSSYECFGMAAAEALIAGRPVLLGSRVGVASLVNDAGCGRVCPATPEAFSALLSEMAAQPQVIADMAKRARAAATSFSYLAHGRSLERLYAELTTAGAEGRARSIGRPDRLSGEM